MYCCSVAFLMQLHCMSLCRTPLQTVFVSTAQWFIWSRVLLQCCVPDATALREFVSHPPPGSVHLCCTMIHMISCIVAVLCSWCNCIAWVCVMPTCSQCSSLLHNNSYDLMYCCSVVFLMQQHCVSLCRAHLQAVFVSTAQWFATMTTPTWALAHVTLSTSSISVDLFHSSKANAPVKFALNLSFLILSLMVSINSWKYYNYYPWRVHML